MNHFAVQKGNDGMATVNPVPKWSILLPSSPAVRGDDGRCTVGCSLAPKGPVSLFSSSVVVTHRHRPQPKRESRLERG